MSFDPISSPVDYVIVNGDRSPGIATITGFADRRNYDERMGWGFTGATNIYKGAPLQRGKLVLQLLTPDDFSAYARWRRSHLQRPSPPTQAQLDRGVARPRPIILDIVHPILDAMDIHRVLVEEVGQPEQDDNGGWTVEIALKEHHPPHRSAQRPTAPRAAQEQIDARDAIMLVNTAVIDGLAGDVQQ
jgi:hypothetical protein